MSTPNFVPGDPRYPAMRGAQAAKQRLLDAALKYAALHNANQVVTKHEGLTAAAANNLCAAAKLYAHNEALFLQAIARHS